MESTYKLSQQRFGAHAQNYVTSQTHAKGADLDRLLEIAQPRPYWHVLDVATGGGHTALKFAPHVARVVASDLTPQMLKAAEAHITGKGVTNVEFKEARAEHLPFDSNAFDLVTCRIAPHHFDDVAQFVKEAARVVRPGGLVLVQDQQMPEDPVIAGYVEAFEKLRDPSHNHALTETEWRAAFAAAELTLESVETLAKPHSFDEWTTTQNVLPSTKACLEALVAAAPPAAVAWLHPCDFGAPEATFVNVHIILAGRKSG
ncbi:MAG: methyltransferase domain-containing protein [Anaerolineae bacterium]|nr:methyltransferase domain-containing protein [Anaerolineae bacterium]